MSVTIECRRVRETDNAVLIDMDGEDVLLPISQVEEMHFDRNGVARTYNDTAHYGGWEESGIARLVRLAIAADEMLHSPHTAQQAALRDALREEGLR